MPVTSTTTKLISRIVVNNGTTQAGNIKTANIAMPAVSVDNFDAAKVYAIAASVSQSLSKALYDIQAVGTESINE